MAQGPLDSFDHDLLASAAWLLVVAAVVMVLLFAWISAPAVVYRWSPDAQTTCLIDKYNFTPNCFPAP